MCKNSSRGPRMFTISTEAGTVTRRSSSKPPSSALGPDAFLSEFEADDSRGRALDASGALAVISDLLSWFLTDDGECQHPILDQEPVGASIKLRAASVGNRAPAARRRREQTRFIVCERRRRRIHSARCASSSNFGQSYRPGAQNDLWPRPARRGCPARRMRDRRQARL
jgi:hypothetical protein